MPPSSRTIRVLMALLGAIALASILVPRLRDGITQLHDQVPSAWTAVKRTPLSVPPDKPGAAPDLR